MFFAGCVFLLTAIFFNQFGFLHPEMGTYIPFHLSGKPLPEIIFNSNMLERPPSTQGRELSYLVDHCDILALAKSVQYGFPLFIPASNFIFITIFGVILFGSFTKIFHLDRVTSALLVCAFWVTPHAYIMGMSRSAKPGAGFFCVLLLMLVYLAIKAARILDLQELRLGGEKVAEVRLGWLRGALLFACGIVLSMFDRQGLYLLAVTTVAAGIISFCLRSRRMLMILWPLVLAIFAHLFYFFIALPFLAKNLGNCTVDYSFNKLDLDTLLAYGPRVGADSLGIFINQVLFSFGNFPILPFGFLILGLFIFLIKYDEKQEKHYRRLDLRGRGWGLPVFTFAFFATWVMFFAMHMKLPALNKPDFQRWAYGIPIVMCLFFLSGLLIHMVRAPVIKTMIRATLCVILLCNIIALPGHVSKIKTGYFNNVAAISPVLRDALLNVYDINYKPNPLVYTNAYEYFGPDGPRDIFVSNGLINNKVTIYDCLKKYALEHSRTTQPLRLTRENTP